MSILEVKNLVKTYGKGDNLVKAVDDVSFTVEEGEFVAIIGASGSGKSTLLHIIGGVDNSTSGEVIVDGENITKLNADKLAIYRREKVGIIYQFYNLIPVLTVSENITLPANLANKTIDQEYQKELIETLGLTDRVNHLPNQLSGGQQQRVAIGRALFNRPKLILADEPTGNLDKKSGDEIVNLLKIANEKYHQTIILVTHDMNIAEKAGRIISVEDGKIIADNHKEQEHHEEENEDSHESDAD
ncbi:ABC transporter ATP-binding protein [Candidatus Saccharibacteria bacterium]|nr:ABC transporter ATP-binding protein [Candidatus Saccharibacteria bacterium]